MIRLKCFAERKRTKKEQKQSESKKKKTEGKMITIKEVAEKAGVSSMTVTRAINNSGYVSEKTREKIEAVIKETGYIPNRLASTLFALSSGLAVTEPLSMRIASHSVCPEHFAFPSIQEMYF